MGLGGKKLWVKPKEDIQAESAHYNMSVDEICRSVDEKDRVRKFEQAMNKTRTPFNRFSSKMIKELVYN